MSERQRLPNIESLVEALPIGVLLIDPSGRIAGVNPATEEMLNMSARHLVGGMIDEVLPDPVRPDTLSAEHGFASFDCVLTIGRGGTIRVDYRETPLTDCPGWRLITLADASHVRRLQQVGERGGGARAAIGAAAMLAHEIKNPLSGIRGAAQLLAADNPGSTTLTGLITAEVDRIADLIDRMEDFTDDRPRALVGESVFPLIDHVRRVAEAGFARHCVIDARFDPSLPAACVDRDALVQVLINLVKNAAEAVENGSDRRVLLTAAYRQGVVMGGADGRSREPLPIEIGVVDHGPGAPADIVDHLFDPFVSGRPEGTGLGLALADKLVRAMGGVIRYERDALAGTTAFRVLLRRAH